MSTPLNHYEKVKDFIDSQLDDWDAFEIKIEAEDFWRGKEYYEVHIINKEWDLDKELKFKADETTIEVEYVEDCWEVVKEYDSSVKWFWITLLTPIY